MWTLPQSAVLFVRIRPSRPCPLLRAEIWGGSGGVLGACTDKQQWHLAGSSTGWSPPTLLVLVVLICPMMEMRDHYWGNEIIFSSRLLFCLSPNAPVLVLVIMHALTSVLICYSGFAKWVNGKEQGTSPAMPGPGRDTLGTGWSWPPPQQPCSPAQPMHRLPQCLDPRLQRT